MIGILIGLVLMMFLAFKGFSIIWVAPFSAGIVALLGGLEVVEAFTGPFMEGFANFAQTWFPVFMLSSIFGKIMDDTGMAETIAEAIADIIGEKHALLGVLIPTAILTYGGISMFVVGFSVYPVALSLYRKSNLPRYLIPGVICLGNFTFTMTAFPGSPQIQNLIPMDYFGTTPRAAPVVGILTGFFMAVVGYTYLVWSQKRSVAKGDEFIEPKDENVIVVDEEKRVNVWLALMPLIVILVALNIFDIQIETSLLLGIALAIVINLKRITKIIPCINDGAKGSMNAIVNTSAAVGFGSVVQATPAFATITEILLGIPGSPLISLAVSVNLLSGVTGSASGGLGISLSALAEDYIAIAEQQGISIEVFHRIASLASGGLDSLPHNGAIITLLAICGLTHKESYFDMFIVGVVIPIVAVIPAIIFASMGLV